MPLSFLKLSNASKRGLDVGSSSAGSSSSSSGSSRHRRSSGTSSSSGTGGGTSTGPHSPAYSQSTSTSETSSVAAEEETILSSLIYCIHYKDGCTWSDELRKLKDHLNVCPHDLVCCPSQCGKSVPRLQLEDHLRRSCCLRRAVCQYCRSIFTTKELENHSRACSYNLRVPPTPAARKLKPQPNKKPSHLKPSPVQETIHHYEQLRIPGFVECAGCNNQMEASLLYNHQLKCEGISMSYSPSEENPVFIPTKDLEQLNAKENEYSNISANANSANTANTCLFTDVGCKFKGKQRCVDAHLKEKNGEHFSLISSVTSKQQQQIAHLRKSLAKLTLNHTGNLIWRIKNFSAKLAEAKAKEGVELVSNAFYTGQYGYKIQASIFLNGNGVGEGSHISVYIKILPGEFDGMVKWPFSHPVSFTLYDQNPDNDKLLNIVEGFNPDPNWINFKRPSTEQDLLGFGFPRFVSHRTLMRGHYLVDDTLFLRIKIDTGRRVSSSS